MRVWPAHGGAGPVGHAQHKEFVADASRQLLSPSPAIGRQCNGGGDKRRGCLEHLSDPHTSARPVTRTPFYPDCVLNPQL